MFFQQTRKKKKKNVSYLHHRHRTETMFDEMENYDWHYFESQLNMYEELFVEAYIYDEFFHRLISDVYLRKIVPTNKSLSISRKFYIFKMPTICGLQNR